ncbi:hypothetical protein [Mammaliicoccus sciuri]|uniref:hypothetical protein n=1 Tax=Mammaliicoccus sciuri TaxID=1296 RepID=UPI002B261BC8|nr:hypothetical protein [Mammaliicoccus sciuri]WQK75239.1 hypothetical protein P3U33_05775 [Mammaliicoccus sciuri]
MKIIEKVKKIFNKNNKEMSPSAYFNEVKNKKNVVTDTSLDEYYNNCLRLITKYESTGQKKALEKLIHLTSCVEKERIVIKSGVDTFVYRDDVFEYIEDVANDVVKIIEMENYSRDIPDDVIEKYNQTKGLFDKFYVLFTDYTGNSERKVQAEKREKDPILFGVFVEKIHGNNYLNDRMYVIGDWEDEYCDLTLEKMVSEYKDSKGKDIGNEIKIPDDLEGLINKIASKENG